MAAPPEFNVQCSFPDGQKVSNTEVDAWELQASRRALLNLKSLLQEETMLALLAPQIAAGDTYFKSLLSQSDGQFRESRIDLSATGIKAAQFLAWFAQVDNKSTPAEAQTFFTEVMAPAHPEHYGLGPYPIGIVEMIGGHICRVRVDNKVPVPEWVKNYGDPKYEVKLPVTGILDDGTVFFYGYQEMRDTEVGCDFRFRILFPAASPTDLFEGHTRHLAIEFRYWISSVARSLGTSFTDAM